MKPLYAVLMDGGFVIKKLQARLRHFPTANDVEVESERIKTRAELAEYELLRIYFYHAPPLAKTITNPIDNSVIDLSQNQNFRMSESLMDSLELKPNFALRKGETVMRGWSLGSSAMKNIILNGTRPLTARDMVPNIVQKGVDLRIGLDISTLALKERVRAVVIVTGDSDMIPAFKLARREGVRVLLDHMGHGVSRELKAHSDIIL
jgi:uncharacterized LabA/DUF88 family protein